MCRKKICERNVQSKTKTDFMMDRDEGPFLCCGQRGSVRADIKVQMMDRDERKGLEAI